jgi:acetoacetyl-CoA reductase
MRVAVITGGLQGIGQAIAATLHAKGYKAVIADRAVTSHDPLLGPDGLWRVHCDVARPEGVGAAFDAIERDCGPVDILVNNAGITRDVMIHKMEAAQHWQPVIDVNLSGVYATCRRAVPGMRERGFGRIVNISSMNGLRGQFGQANYSAAKAGMIAFTKSIAQELAAKGVTANCIAPGFIETPMTQAMKPEVLETEKKKIPVGRLGQPFDIARAVLFLVDDAADFITGETLSVNGGQLMS